MVSEHIDDEGYQVFDKVTVRLERTTTCPPASSRSARTSPTRPAPASREDVAVAAGRRP